MRGLRFSRQPLAWLHLGALVLGLAAAFGLNVTAEQTAAIMAVLQALAAAAGWTQVTPVNAPNLPNPDPG